MITVLQITIAIILFFLINLIGKYAPTELKYFQISNFLETDEAPAFNFTFRVLTPVVFIIVLSAILYHLNLDFYVKDIYFISIYYVMFRVIFNMMIGRTFLVNWKKQFIVSFFIIAISYFAYDKFISKRENLLPDFSNISNELWIIIMIFLYNLINKIPSSDLNAEKRKYAYINYVYSSIKSNYSEIINSKAMGNIRLKQIIYAIIIHENFNRPKAYRVIENLSGLFSKNKSYGIMQVRSSKPLSDNESVKEGTKIILKNYHSLISEYNSEIAKEYDTSYDSIESIDELFQMKLIRSYNHCDDYTADIIELTDYLNTNFYNNKEENKLLFYSK